MIVSIHQPAYLPWLGYFEKIARSDVFVILDTTQFEKNSFINRNKIKSANSEVMLTVPVVTSNLFKRNLLTETKIDTRQDWARKHWKTIELNYRKTPFFHRYAPALQRVYAQSWDRITPLCIELTRFFCEQLGIKTKIVLASELEKVYGFKTDLVLNICQRLGATTYISGALGKEYLEDKNFAAAGISIMYQDYHHPVYPQQYGPFIPYLSILDLLCNCGEQSLNILLSTSQVGKSYKDINLW